ncbi:MAG TPA: response regulator [Rugosimonospora sp.]|nr:response regulator [Rugosimonospora sp.]
MALPQLAHIELPKLGSESARILVVDDEADIRNLIAAKLTSGGFEVQTASGGRKALSIMERWSPDLAILDVSMPEMSGIELCKHLRGTLRTQELPIIMLTARTHIKHEHEGLMAGADVYLTKPFSPRALLAEVHDLLSYTRK